MLKATGEGPPSGDDRSIGELATQLVDDAKAYARTEFDLLKAIASEKAKSLKVAAIFFGAALLVAIGAMTALSVAVFAGLATIMNPVLAGIAAFVLIGAVAGLIAWAGVAKLKDAL